MQLKQKEFYDRRYSIVKRALHKLENNIILFYDVQLIKKLLRILNAGSVDSVLEVGCGQGTDAVLISKYTRHIVAMDISFHSLKVATILSRMKGVSEKISFVVGDGEHLPFRKGLFDIVFCRDLLHHVPNSIFTILEMKRVSKNAGKVIAIEANACNPQMMLIGLIYFSVDKGVFKNTKTRLNATFEEAGLSDVHAEETELLPRHLLFEYRSPLCRPFISKSKLILRILCKIENSLQNLSIIESFANYIIIYGVKKTDFQT